MLEEDYMEIHARGRERAVGEESRVCNQTVQMGTSGCLEEWLSGAFAAKCCFRGQVKVKGLDTSGPIP